MSSVSHMSPFLILLIHVPLSGQHHKDKQTELLKKFFSAPQFFSCSSTSSSTLWLPARPHRMFLCQLYKHMVHTVISIVSLCAYVVFSVCSIQDSSSFLSFHLFSPLTPFPPLLLLFSLLPVPSLFPFSPFSPPLPPLLPLPLLLPALLIPLSGQYHKGKQAELLELFSAPNSPYFFLFSTQTGCLVLKIRSADTVIFDSDWNHHQVGAIMYFMSCH